jgi:tRNA threonylcarbamoyladenosine biosynthesis protein TsaE
VGEIKTLSEKETFALGARFAKEIKKTPTLILLTGPVGSGKTVWTKGFVWGYLKDKNCVTSPSYSLINQYKKGKRTVTHVDLYRLSSEDDFESIGFWDLLEQKSVIITEWGNHLERIPEELPVFSITFEIIKNNQRLIRIIGR